MRVIRQASASAGAYYEGVFKSEAQMTTPTLRLNADVQLPIVGFGTYLITNEDAPAAVSEALRVGYRHIDTAEGYANESGVGAAIRESGLHRSEVFVTTKLWPGNSAWGQTP